MLTDKAKVELSPKDQTFLVSLVNKGVAGLTPVEKSHVVARKEYLTKETIKENGIDELENESVEVDGSVEVEYKDLKVADLKELCEERGIEGATKKDEMIEALIADDNGDLDEEEEEEK